MTRRIPVIVALLAVLLTVAFWFLLYDPLRQEQVRYTGETAQLEAERSELTSRIAVLREVEQNVEDYESQLVRLAGYVPDDPAQPVALKELQRIADESGLEITEVSFADPELVPDAPETADPETVLARIPTQMRVSGAYFQVVDMLRRIEVEMGRAVKVETVTLAEDDELAFPDLTVTWTGQVYAVLPIDETAGAEEVVVEEAEEGASEGASEAPDAGEGTSDEPTASPAGDAGEPTDTTDAGTS
jgi:Tfp pilus assembly protein PilO